MQALTIQLKNESLAAKLLRCVLRQDQYPTCEEGGKSDGTGDGAGAGAGAGAADSADVDVETPIENGFPLSRGSAGPEPELSAAAESWSRATVMHDVALECATHFTRRLRAEVCRLWMLSLGWSQSSVLSADQAVLFFWHRWPQGSRRICCARTWVGSNSCLQWPTLIAMRQQRAAKRKSQSQ